MQWTSWDLGHAAEAYYYVADSGLWDGIHGNLLFCNSGEIASTVASCARWTSIENVLLGRGESGTDTLNSSETIFIFIFSSDSESARMVCEYEYEIGAYRLWIQSKYGADTVWFWINILSDLSLKIIVGTTSQVKLPCNFLLRARGSVLQGADD